MKILILLLLLMCALTTLGQNVQKNLFISKTPLSSEDVSARVDSVSILMQSEPVSDAMLFIVARLGRGEANRELNRRRLYNVRQRFAVRIPTERMVVVEGERIDDLGRIELYWKGVLVDAFPIRKNKDIDVDCCGDDERYYPFKDAVERRQKQKRKRGLSFRSILQHHSV